jgi:dihydrofolate reductase
MAEWVQGRKTFAQKTGFIESEEEMEVALPQELANFKRFMFCEEDVKGKVLGNSQFFLI